MHSPHTLASIGLLVPLMVAISYTDIRYRRIPNSFVLATLVSGLLLNTLFGGFNGLLTSLGGCALAFVLMLVLHIFGAMGAGDVKLFAAIGSIIGMKMVLPTFVIILITGFVLAVYSMFRAGIARATLFRVFQFFIGLLPGWQDPRFDTPADRRHTIPYGVAITFGSLISLVIFRVLRT
ncbi:MAG: A24 family peptidase [Acidobacteriota bacterium]|nr:A24 family peptidase [Acidobacteriota bacterium]